MNTPKSKRTLRAEYERALAEAKAAQEAWVVGDKASRLEAAAAMRRFRAAEKELLEAEK